MLSPGIGQVPMADSQCERSHLPPRLREACLIPARPWDCGLYLADDCESRKTLSSTDGVLKLEKVNSKFWTLDFGLYLFPMTSITNPHNFSGLKNTNLFSYSSGGPKSKMGLKQLKSRGSRVLGENLSLTFSGLYRFPTFLVCWVSSFQPLLPLSFLLLWLGPFASFTC